MKFPQFKRYWQLGVGLENTAPLKLLEDKILAYGKKVRGTSKFSWP